MPNLKVRNTGPLAVLSRPILLSCLLAAVTVLLYYPVQGHPFINYDDNGYVYQNSHVEAGLSWTTVKWAFSTSDAANWHPLTWLAHATDCQLFALNPGAHHLVNVAVHVINVVLLFWVLLSATGFAGRSFMVAALFAVHPVNVESVAWVAELKTLLSTLFFLLGLASYEWYAKRPRPIRMAVVSLLFACGLMAKPQIITFPFVLLLLDYWPLRRLSTPRAGWIEPENAGLLPQASLWRLLIEKIPLFVLAAGSAVITMLVQHDARHWYTRSSRLGNAVLSYGLYIKKAIWPFHLGVLYPHPGSSLNWGKVALSALLLLAISSWVLLHRRRRYLVVGWLWFLGTLVPMLGLVQVGIQAMADRYAYVSFIGLFIMLCWGLADWAELKRLPAVLPVASVLALVALTLVARRQIQYWALEEDLWRHDLQITDRNWMAESELGTALATHGKVEEAVHHFKRALAINPDDVSSNMGLAIYYIQKSNFAEAIRHYEAVVKDPFAQKFYVQQAYLGLAKSYAAVGDPNHARESLVRAQAFSTP